MTSLSTTKLSDRIRWVLWSRVVFLGVMATSAICLNFVYGDTIPTSVLWAIFLGLSFSFVSRALLYFQSINRWLKQLAILQLLADALLTSFLIHQTGGLSSAFILLYGLNIVTGGVILLSSGVFQALFLSILGYASVTFYTLKFDFFEDPNALIRFVLVNSVLTLVGALVAGLFRNREQLVQSLERASADLTKLMELQSAIVSHIPTGLLIVNPAGRISYSNPACKEILGQDFLNRSEKDLPFALELTTRPYEVSSSKTESEPRVLLVETLELDSGNRLVVFTDISSLRKLETEMRVKEKLAGVGQLAAGLAHEIKNPLASLSGSIQMLQRAEHEAEYRDGLMNIIMRETDRLDELLNGFLNYAKPGQIRLEKVRIASLIEEIVQMLKSQDKNSMIRFHLDLDPEITCACDAHKIRQVIWNLSRNAVAAIDGEGDVHFRLMERHRRARIEIEDTGRGIPEEIRSRIYEPFFSTSAQGTGLGLALVYQMVSAHNGRMGFDSSLGKGTKFWIELEKELSLEETSAA